MVRLQGSGALNVFHVVLLVEEFNSIRQTTHLALRTRKDRYGLLFGLHDSLEVEGNVSHNDSVLLHRILRFIIPINQSLVSALHKRGVQKSLRRNAAHIQTGTAQSTTLFDTSGLQSKLSSFNGRHISSRASSDHDNIKSSTHAKND